MLKVGDSSAESCVSSDYESRNSWDVVAHDSSASNSENISELEGSIKTLHRSSNASHGSSSLEKEQNLQNLKIPEEENENHKLVVGLLNKEVPEAKIKQMEALEKKFELLGTTAAQESHGNSQSEMKQIKKESSPGASMFIPPDGVPAGYVDEGKHPGDPPGKPLRFPGGSPRDKRKLNLFEWLRPELEQIRAENANLRKELSEKTLQMRNLKSMLVSLGKEKEIMAKELALKARLLTEMEEHASDLKTHNQALASRLESYARESKAKLRDCNTTIASLQNRNRELSEHLLKSTDACRLLKTKYKQVQEQNKVLKEASSAMKISLHKHEVEKKALTAEVEMLKSEYKASSMILKQQMQDMQEELTYLRTENNLLLQEASYEEQNYALNLKPDLPISQNLETHKNHL